MQSTLAMFTVAALLYTVKPTNDKKTVVFLPMIVSSHAMVYELVAHELALLGHDVHLAVPSAFSRRLHTNSSSGGPHYFSYDDFVDISEDMFIKQCEDTLANTTQGEPDWSWIAEYSNVLSDVFFKAMNERGLVDFVRKLQPDLLVVDWSPRINELVAVPYALGVPFAVLSPLFSAATARVPFNPLEDAMNSIYFRSTSFYEKLWILLDIMYPLYYDLLYDTGYVGRVAPDKPSITTSDLMSRAEIFLFEIDHILDYPRPSLPNIKFLGGITPRPAKALKEPFRTFVDNSHVGVAVVSFGSLFVNFPKTTTDKLVAVLKQLKLNVVWRANITSPDPHKMLVSSWIPQNDLLGHRNTKLFISHCGTHGQYEALYHAVPVVCLPIFFDQGYNAERFKAKKFALVGNLWTDSVETLVKVIQEATKSQEIQQSITTASEIYHQLYKDPTKEAAFWLDHVIKYGGTYMRSNTQKIPMYQYNLIYFLFLVAGVFITLILAIIAAIIYKVISYLCSRKQKPKED